MTHFRYTVHNSLPNLPARTITVDVPIALAPTDEKVINYVKRQQPYLIVGEVWEVVGREPVDHAGNPTVRLSAGNPTVK